MPPWCYGWSLSWSYTICHSLQRESKCSKYYSLQKYYGEESCILIANQCAITFPIGCCAREKGYPSDFGKGNDIMGYLSAFLLDSFRIGYGDMLFNIPVNRLLLDQGSWMVWYSSSSQNTLRHICPIWPRNGMHKSSPAFVLVVTLDFRGNTKFQSNVMVGYLGSILFGTTFCGEPQPWPANRGFLCVVYHGAAPWRP